MSGAMRIAKRRVTRVGEAVVIALGALLAAGTGLVGCRTTTMDVRYAVTVRNDASPGVVPISIRLTNAPPDSCVLIGRVPVEVSGLRRVVAATAAGRMLTVDSQSVAVGFGDRELRVPRFVIRGPLPSVVLVHYSVEIGIPEGNDHTGYSGRQYGASEPDYLFTTGRNLFLIPEDLEAVGKVRVRLGLPRAWDALTPWPASGSLHELTGPSETAAEDLIAAPLAFGIFQRQHVAAAGSRVEVIAPASVSRPAFERATERFAGSLTRVAALTGRPLPEGYRAILLPRASSGNEIIGGAAPLTQGQTLIPLTAGRLRSATLDLLASTLRRSSAGPRVTRQEEFWLVDAIEGWFATRIAWEAFGYRREEVLQELAGRYLEASVNPSFDGGLSDLYRGGMPGRAGQSLVAPLALGLLDHALRTRSGAPDSIEGRMHSFFRSKRAPSLWSLLPKQDAYFTRFRDSVVTGLLPLPVDSIWSLIALETNPSIAPGPPQRWLSFAYTGRTDGFLENCGCKVNQSGGVARRASALTRFRRKYPDALVLDAGDAFLRPQQQSGLDPLSAAEQGLVAEVLAANRYDALAIGLTELTFGHERFRELTGPLRLPYVATNLGARDGRLAHGSRSFSRAGLDIAVLGLFERPLPAGALSQYFEEAAESLKVEDAVERARAELDGLAKSPDLLIALGNLTPHSIRRLVARCPELDLVISTEFNALLGPAKGGEAPGARQERPGFCGQTLVLYTRATRYGVSTARLGVDAQGRIARAELADVWLADSIPDDRRVRAMLDRFYARTASAAGRAAKVPRLFAEDRERQEGRYVGAETCRGCHSSEHAQWQSTSHADAYKTLLESRRHSNPRCVACHVVGFGTRQGFQFGSPDESLANVQCEVCHGPGGSHVTDPRPGTIRARVPESVCLECHTPEHSDNFVYREKLPRVLHRPAADLVVLKAAPHRSGGGGR